MKSTFRLTAYVLLLSIIFVFILTFSINRTEAGGGTLTKDDYLKWVGREVDLTWACTYYDSNYAAVADIQMLSSAEKSTKWHNKHYVTGDGYWEALFNYTAYEPVYTETEVCYTEDLYDNVTNQTVGQKEICYNTMVKSGTKPVTRQRWEPYNWDRNAKHLRFCAKLKPILGERNIEHVPVMFGYEFDEYDWWNSSWKKCRDITIDHTKIDSDLEDFPTYVKLALSDLTGAQPDLDDIRFVNASCSNNGSLLNYALEHKDGTYAHFHVRVPLVSAGADTVFSVYYNNSGAPNAENEAGVYVSTYKIVLDMNCTGTTCYDSTSYGNGASQTGGREPWDVPGIMGWAQNFTGGDNMQIDDDSSPHWGDPAQNATVAMWIYETGDNWGTPALFIHRSSKCDSWNFHFGSNWGGGDFGLTLYVRQEESCHDERVDSDSLGMNNLTGWTFLVGTHDATADELKLYANGQLDKTETSATLSDVTPDSYLCVGAAKEDGADAFSGAIDHVVLKVGGDIDEAWINATYYSQSNQLLTVGAEVPYQEENCSESGGDTAIKAGIQNALQDAPIFDDQHIYLRRANSDQENGTFDWVTIHGNQTWAFNYVTSGDSNPKTNMKNLTTIVYVWEGENLPCYNITTEVEGLIDSTKV